MIELEIHDGVAEVVLNAPGKLNALNEQALAELGEAYEQAERRSHTEGMVPAWSVLFTRVWDDPELRSRYLAILGELLDTHFREEELGPRAAYPGWSAFRRAR